MNGKRDYKKEKHHLAKAEIKIGFLNGTTQSSISDTGDISHAGLQGEPLITTNDNSSKFFYLPNGTISHATKVEKIEHNVQEPERTIDMVPELVHHTLLSASNFSDADYISIYDGDDVNIYYG